MENQIQKNEEILLGLIKRYKCNPVFILRNFDKLNSLGGIFDTLEDFHLKNNLSWNSDFGIWEEVELKESKVNSCFKKENNNE
jgi:hypothetical protein